MGNVSKSGEHVTVSVNSLQRWLPAITAVISVVVGYAIFYTNFENHVDLPAHPETQRIVQELITNTADEHQRAENIKGAVKEIKATQIKKE